MNQDRNGKLMGRVLERERWIKKYQASGLGLRQFAQRHRLRPGQLHYWVYQSPKPPAAKAPLPRFQEMRLPAAGLTAGSWSAEIALPNGTTVRLAGETDLAWTMALVNSLRQPCSSH